MALRIDDEFPDFQVETSRGPLSFHDWVGARYAILFSHPKDFTPVCTTEFGEVARLWREFERRNTKVVGISVDGLSDHHRWIGDIEHVSGAQVHFPIIADADLRVSKLLDMLPGGRIRQEQHKAGETATVRSVFIVGPDMRLRLSMTYPMSVGRNFDEILRALDAIQISDGFGIATPANWRPGEDMIVPPTVSDDAATQQYGGFTAVLPYLRKITVDQVA